MFSIIFQNKKNFFFYFFYSKKRKENRKMENIKLKTITQYNTSYLLLTKTFIMKNEIFFFTEKKNLFKRYKSQLKQRQPTRQAYYVHHTVSQIGKQNKQPPNQPSRHHLLIPTNQPTQTKVHKTNKSQMT